MTDNRNTILAVILSGIVLIAWQYFYNMPQMERQRAAQRPRRDGQDTRRRPNRRRALGHPQPAPAAAVGHRARAGPPAPPAPAVSRPRCRHRRDAAHQDRHPAPFGSISLKGARIDDLSLVQFRRPSIRPRRRSCCIRPRAPRALLRGIRLGAAGRLTVQDSRPEHEMAAGRLGRPTPTNPVTLKYDNGEGLTFRRTISIDDRCLFTIKDDVTNVGNAPVTLYPYALISRHGAPKVSGYYILHEGLIGYLGDQGLQEYTYKKIDDAKAVELQGHRRLARHHRQILGLGAAAGYLDAQLQARTRRTSSARSGPIRPIIWRIRRPSRSAAPAAPMPGCSPAPRKPASSASISRSAASAATTRNSGSTTSI